MLYVFYTIEGKTKTDLYHDIVISSKQQNLNEM